MNIVVTGTSSGIGQVLARRLVGGGHHVRGLARRPQVDRDDPDSGGTFRAVVTDVADWESVSRGAGETLRVWEGRVDALVCCAGTQGAVGPAMGLDPAAWARTVRDNLEGVFFPVRAFHPGLQRGAAVRRAKVICFSGGGAASPRPNFSAYGVAKAGIVRLVETLAWEFDGSGVDINAVAPGALPTAMTEEVLRLGPTVAGAAEYAAAERVAAQGEAAFAEVGGLVDYLLSAASDGITGRLLSARWDPWATLETHREELAGSDVYTLRRITPEDRGKRW